MKENPYSAQYLLHISTLYKKLGEEANIRGEKSSLLKWKKKRIKINDGIGYELVNCLTKARKQHNHWSSYNNWGNAKFGKQPVQGILSIM